MKQFITITLLILCLSAVGYSQVRHRPVRPPEPRTRMARARAFERIRAVKVAYITNRLNFTSEQSAKFWPVYNKYEQDIQAKRKEFTEKYANTNPGTADDNTSRKYINDNLDYQQAVLNIRRQYNDEFLKIISPQQVEELYKSEREFNQMLIQQLKNKHNGNNNNNNNNNTTNESMPEQ